MSTQIPGLYLMETSERGRGVFTSRNIEIGDMIESAPVILCNKKDREVIHKTILHDYYFLWEKDNCAIALGYGSLYNHSETPNAEFIFDYENECIDFEAIKKIESGEEILINYQTVDDDKFSLWFEVK